MGGGRANESKNDDARDGNREIVLTRVFDASCEVVWDAWTDPKQVVKWWGPSGFSLTIHEMDVRTGGVWKSTMRGPDGTEYLNNCAFIEVIRPKLIAYKLTGGTKKDHDMPMDVSWIFEAHGEQTKLILRMVFPTAEVRERAATKYKVVEGGIETLDRLREHLEDGVVR